MNQQKECFEFLDARVSKEIGASIKQLLSVMEEKSLGKYWEAPAIAKFPEESDDAKWHLWWADRQSNHYISVDWYDANDLYLFYRNRKNNSCIGEEITLETFPDEILNKIFEIRYARQEKEDD